MNRAKQGTLEACAPRTRAKQGTLEACAPRKRLVVIGNGMAGARLVEDVLARGGGALFDIVVFGDEPYGNYNRILLSGVLSGAHNSQDIFINPLGWYEENGIKLHAGVRVTEIDRSARRVRGGFLVEQYDKLVFATGSSPFVPGIDGLYMDRRAATQDWRPDTGQFQTSDPESQIFKEGVFLFRTLDDCKAISRHAEGARKAVVIGGGLLGLEAARGLLSLGLEVHVVHLMPYLMEVQLDASAGRVLKRTLEHMGVGIHLEKNTAAVLGEGRVTGLQFNDGSTLDCDMVVISAGIKPNVSLAKQAGLAVERGIVVGDDLASPTDPDVHAVGECAQHRGQVYGFVAPIWEQTRVLAERLTGRKPTAAYGGSKVSTKLKVMGVELAVMGKKEPEREDDEVVTFADPTRGTYKKLIIRDGRLLGAIVLGDGTGAVSLVQAFDRGTQLPDSRGELLFPAVGDGIGNGLVLAYVPDSAQICNCNGVTKGKILEAINNGHRTLSAVCGATRAGTGCGTCRPQVQGILELACPDAPRTSEPVPGPATLGPLVLGLEEHDIYYGQ